MSKVDLAKLFDSFSAIKVGVIGDIMLDVYCWGNVERISPEAPVPVVSVTGRELRVGGAGNVALNLKSLGAQISLMSVIGDDNEGELLKELLAKEKIGTEFILKSGDRLTTHKTRIISRNQQMMRLDAEVTSPLTESDEEKLLTAFSEYITREKPQILLLEDYNKGVLTERVIKEVIEKCKQHSIITSVDPKRRNFFCYQGVDIFKPNFKEAKEGLNIIGEDVSEPLLNEIHEALHQRLNHRISFITLSEKGVYYQQDGNARLIPTHIRKIADVSGAGDTVIAVASLVYAATGDVRLMAQMANIAGGLVCEEVGTVAVNKDKLKEECLVLLD